jgi:uncharacterized lipoprotein YmbA
MRVVILLAMASCSALSAQEDRTRYFTLRPLAVPERQPVSGFDRTVGIGPIVVPDHLEHGLVTRIAGDEIAISDLDRWAEPLHDLLGRGLRQNLIALLRTERIQSYPWDLSTTPDIAVSLEILHFERTAQGMADLAVRWTLERGADRAPLLTQETRISKPIKGTDTRAVVAALSEALVTLSRDIAAAVRPSPK